MANYKTGAQRYNDRMDKLWASIKENQGVTKSGHTYDKRFYRENKKGAIVKALSKFKNK